MSRKAWKELTQDELRTLWQTNTQRDISEKFVVSVHAVRSRLKRLDTRKRPFVSVEWQKITWPILHGFIVDGMTYTQIGRLFGVTKSAVAGKVYWFRRKRAK